MAAKDKKPEAVVERLGTGDYAVSLPDEPVVLDAVPPPPAPPVRVIKPSRAYYTRCRVEGTTVVSGGKTFEPGTVDEFPDGDVLSLPEHLIPVE